MNTRCLLTVFNRHRACSSSQMQYGTIAASGGVAVRRRASAVAASALMAVLALAVLAINESNERVELVYRSSLDPDFNPAAGTGKVSPRIFGAERLVLTSRTKHEAVGLRLCALERRVRGARCRTRLESLGSLRMYPAG